MQAEKGRQQWEASGYFVITFSLQQDGGLKPDGTQTVVGNSLQALQLQPGGVLTPILPPTQSGAPTFVPVTVSGVSIYS